MLHPDERWLQLAFQKLTRPSLATYASALRTLVQYLTSNNSPLQSQLEYAFAAYSDAVGPGRIWIAVSAHT